MNSFPFSLCAILLPSILVSNYCVHMQCTVYVQPNSTSEDGYCHCPVSECKTFDEYISYLKLLKGLEESDNSSILVDVTLIFLCGKHKLQNENHTTIDMSYIHNLSIQGDGSDPSRVVVHDMNLVFQNVPELHLANITIKGVTFRVFPSQSDPLKDRASFHIMNCIFIQSDCLIVGSDLTIQDSSVINGTNTAFNLVSSTLTLVGTVTFTGNTGERGGALELTATTITISENANITFNRNSATEKGGAIFMNNPTEIFKVFSDSTCFYHLLDYDDSASYSVTFIENSAQYGGSHVFGLSLKSNCTAATDTVKGERIPSYKVISSGRVFHFEEPGLSDMPIESAVSASHARVCICEEDGDSLMPMCSDSSKIFMLTNFSRYPGESFNLSFVIVGGDFGPTTGNIQAHLLNTNFRFNRSNLIDRHISCDHDVEANCYKLVRTINCTKLEYMIHSRNPYEVVSLTAMKSNPIRSPTQSYQEAIEASISRYMDEGVIDDLLMFTPLFINVTLKDCPLGFNFAHNSSRCDCYMSLKQKFTNLKCVLRNDGGYLSHPNIWIGADSLNDEVILSIFNYCPFCNRRLSGQEVNLLNNTSIDAQCDFDRAGRLCGKCRKGYSLAIGSSRCIKCYNNNNLALLIFFAVAGVLLIVIITSMNLTVTYGMINGVIFYANIIWVYESIIFPPKSTGILQFLRIFIAWLNLDFGIETCFVVGLSPFWKTLLQYIFPLYIWSLIGIVILGAKYSTKLTKLLGSQTVSVLSTLTLLSYMKLLRNAVVSLQFARLNYHNKEGAVHTIVAWPADGSLNYCNYPHIFLFVTALVVVCLCLPYTLLLLFSRWFREVPHLTKFHPIFDSHFASFKSKHHYWSGLLLVVRVFLYLIKISFVDQQATFILLVTTVLLLCLTSGVQPHRSRAVFLLHNIFLVNLILLSGSTLYVYSTSQSKDISYITIVSTALAFVEFIVIVVASVAKSIPYSWFCSSFHKIKYRATLRRRIKSQIVDPEDVSVSYIRLRESILEDNNDIYSEVVS